MTTVFLILLTVFVVLMITINNKVDAGYSQNAFLMGYEEEFGETFNGNYVYNECDGVKSVIHLTKVDIVPKQFEVKKNITLSIGINITKDVQPTSIHIKIYKNMPLVGYVKLPCILKFGSCTYENICEKYKTLPKDSLGYHALCPKWLTSTGIKCRCPFKKGYYSTSKIKIPISSTFVPKWIASGDYKASLIIDEGNTCLGCYKFDFRLK